MILFPAIDLYEGQVVRLYQGDYQRMTVYGQDPMAVAERFAQAGAEYLHVVDLEGAKTGGTPNLDVIRKLAVSSGLHIQVGGGIRSEKVAAEYLSSGVERIIIGTAAVTQPGFVKTLTNRFGDAVAVGIDVRQGMVAIQGWTETTGLDLFVVCRQMEADGVSTVICTDIAKDGAMSGTNRSLYRRLRQETNLQVIASGGISTLEDIIALRDIRVFGAILGKSLYTGAIDLSAALRTAKEGASC